MKNKILVLEKKRKRRGEATSSCVYILYTDKPFSSPPLLFISPLLLSCNACLHLSFSSSRSCCISFSFPHKNQWKQTGIFEGEKMRGKKEKVLERGSCTDCLLPIIVIIIIIVFFFSPLFFFSLLSSSSSLLSNFSHAFDRIRVTSFPSSSSLDRNERPLRRLLRTCFLSLFLRYTFAFSHLLFAYRFPLYLVFLFLSLIFAECTLLFVVPHSLVLTKIQGKKERDRKVNEKKSP